MWIDIEEKCSIMESDRKAFYEYAAEQSGTRMIVMLADDEGTRWIDSYSFIYEWLAMSSEYPDGIDSHGFTCSWRRRKIRNYKLSYKIKI